MSVTDQPLAPAPRRNQGNRHTRRWLPYAGGILLLAGIVAGLWPQPVPVETAPATLGTLRAVVAEDGKTRIKQRFVVSAPVTGQLRRIPFKAGAEVQARQTVVAVIDPLPPSLLDARARSLAEARRDATSASLDKARTAHAWAASERGRFEMLSKDKTVSVQELEAAQFRELSAAKDMAAAEGSLREAEAQLAEFAASGSGGTNSICDPTEVVAPAGGRVLRVLEENSRVVTAGTPLVEIGDPTDLEVVVEVLSRDGAAIVPGSKVEFEQWGGAAPLIGRVRLVEPAAFTKVSALGVEEQRVNVIADLLTPPEQRRNVGDSFRVEARIIIWEADNALKVPAGALFRRGEQWAAFVVANERAELRLLKTGRSSGVEMQVLDGLRPGEQVILYPGSRVRGGQRVRTISI
jgi:HlyD family secretion protein